MNVVSSLAKLKGAKSRKDLANLLGYKPSALTSIIYQTPIEQKYYVFEIPKANGELRTIKAPNPKLKKLQKHLANLLYTCLDEIEKERNVRPVSYGFRKVGNIAANARNHKCRRYVLNLDLENFFPTFNFGRVRGFFLKNTHFELDERIATTIAQIACDGTALPQGSPCSPVISELVGQILDIRLLRFSRKHGVRYSRYADDLTFSTNQKEFPTALAVRNSALTSEWELSDPLISEVKRAGFEINDKKTRMHCRDSRQLVNGLVVNKKANIKSEYYRKARAMCDSIFQTGSYFHSFTLPPSQLLEPEPELIDNLNPIEGILSHIYAITQSEEKRDVQLQRTEPRAIRVLYRRFLFYKYCMAWPSPLIVTEGKTDPIYLKAAIRYSPKFHPQLGNHEENGFQFAVTFFNYRGQAHELMDLSGGTDNLKSIPLDYLRNLKPKKSARKPFRHKPMVHPVILLLDNDGGLKAVASTIKDNFEVQISTSSKEDFYHITDNLYLIKTPENTGDSCIEDLFPNEWREKRLNNKRFKVRGKINPTTEYGKEVFAKSVIKPNAHAIDFSKFDVLLNRIVAVMDDYEVRKRRENP